MSINRWIAVLSFLALLATATASPSVQPDPAQPAVTQMVLRVLVTPDTGPTREVASSNVALAIGQSGSTMFATSADLCGRGIGGAGATDHIGSPRHVWTVRFTLNAAEIDRIAVDVDVERQDDGLGGARRTLRQLILTEGAPHILDFVESSGRTCGQASAVLEVSAVAIESPALSRRLLNYDLWLTQRDGTGREWTRREARTAEQGERVDFRFQPLMWSTTMLMPSLGIDLTIDERVSGSIRGRLRADGQLELSLATSRRLGHGNGWTGSEGGTKVFTARAGEAVSVELPRMGGRSLALSAAGTPALLDYQELFKSHTTAVVLVVSPLPDGTNR